MVNLLLFVVLSATPTSETQAAAADIARLPIADQPYARYVSTYNLDKAADVANVLRFWTNSLSRRRRIAHMAKVNDSLYRLDLREYGIHPDAWESLIVDPKTPHIRTEVYFAADTLEQQSEYQLRLLSHSYGAIVRADFFIAKTSLEPHYSAFLGLPNELAKLEAQFFIDRKGVEAMGLAQGGAVLQSIVALHNRQLERWPTLTGYWWLSRDTRTSVGDQNVLETPFAVRHDAGEFIWSLPNGLQAYYLANAAGKQQVEVPADIAIDKRTSLQDGRVRNAMSCVTCHEAGINHFDNVIAKLIRQGATFGSKDKEKTLAIEEYHLSPLGKQITADQERYAAAVLACNGLDTKANAAAFELVVKQYLEGRVSLAIAAREIGCEEERLKAVAPTLYSGTLNALLAGESIARDAWESLYYSTALACKETDK